mgnify:CR=1 FL=1
MPYEGLLYKGKQRGRREWRSEQGSEQGAGARCEWLRRRPALLVSLLASQHGDIEVARRKIPFSTRGGEVPVPPSKSSECGHVSCYSFLLSPPPMSSQRDYAVLEHGASGQVSHPMYAVILLTPLPSQTRML